MKKRKIKKKIVHPPRGKSEYIIYSIGIPEKIAKQIPSDLFFDAELTEEGILFKPILPKKEPDPPSWCNKTSG